MDENLILLDTHVHSFAGKERESTFFFSPRAHHDLGKKAREEKRALEKSLRTFIQKPEAFCSILGEDTWFFLYFQKFLLPFAEETGKNHIIVSYDFPQERITFLEQQDFLVEKLSYTQEGVLDLEQFSSMIHPKTAWTFLPFTEMWTGILQPVEALATIAQEKNIRVHLDLSHAIGSCWVDLSFIPCFSCSFSLSSIHVQAEATIILSQESFFQTHDLFLLKEIDQALKLCSLFLENKAMEQVHLRAQFEEKILKQIPSSYLCLETPFRQTNRSLICFPQVFAETFSFFLQKKRVYTAVFSPHGYDLQKHLQECFSDKNKACSTMSFGFSRFLSKDAMEKAIKAVIETHKTCSSFTKDLI